MEHGESYIVFGIVNALTGFWYAAALLMILQNEALGWVLGLLSLPLIWGMKRYIAWLFRSSDRRQRAWLLLSWQAVPTMIFLLAFPLIQRA